VLAGRLLAIWILDGTPSTKWHPGYYLPSVGAPLVASAEAATLGYRSLAVVLFGFGVISWILIGAVLLAQLVGGQRLPKPLIPTMAILIAPPLVAGNAWFAIDGGRVDRIALALAGYALLMAIVQLGLVPLYRTVLFLPSRRLDRQRHRVARRRTRPAPGCVDLPLASRPHRIHRLSRGAHCCRGCPP